MGWSAEEAEKMFKLVEEEMAKVPKMPAGELKDAEDGTEKVNGIMLSKRQKAIYDALISLPENEKKNEVDSFCNTGGNVVSVGCDCTAAIKSYFVGKKVAITASYRNGVTVVSEGTINDLCAQDGKVTDIVLAVGNNKVLPIAANLIISMHIIMQPHFDIMQYTSNKKG
jgi:hypothetical protein